MIDWKMMDRLKQGLFWLLLAPLASSAVQCTDLLDAASPIEAIGVYASAPGDGASYWYGIDLWHAGDCYFGYLRATRSREGDAPAGIIVFRSASGDGAMTFTARLSDGVLDQGPDKPAVAAQDLFEFAGTFKRKQITGAFTHSELVRGTRPVTHAAKLILQADSARIISLSAKGTTFLAWNEDATALLRNYGPRW